MLSLPFFATLLGTGTIITTSVITLASLYVIWFVFLRTRLPPGIASLPLVTGALPFIGAGFKFIANPRAFFDAQRLALGDTFVTKMYHHPPPPSPPPRNTSVIHMFGITLVCTFSPRGLRSLYEVREKDASFAEATKGLLGLKLPPEVLAHGSMSAFHRSLSRPRVATYLRTVNRVVEEELVTLPASGHIDIFPHMKRIVHKIGFLSWVGEDALQPVMLLQGDNLSRLTRAFEVLDPETSFQSLWSLASTIFTGKWGDEVIDDNLNTLHEGFKQEFPGLSDRARSRLCAHTVFQFHLASQANLYAALSWTLVNLLTEPAAQASRVLEEHERLCRDFGSLYLNNMDTLDRSHQWLVQVSQESLRLSQQSITLRKAMTPFDFVSERGSCSIATGVYLCTLLSVTNADDKFLKQDAQPDLKLLEFDASRYEGVDPDPKVWKEDLRYLVSTYGHLAHACPGRTFALSAIKIVLVKYLNALHLNPQFSHARVPETSVGAIGRSANPCVAAHSRRTAKTGASSFCKLSSDESLLPMTLPPASASASHRSVASAAKVVAVIGGAGFLGSRLVAMLIGHAQELEAKGHPYFTCIRVLDRSPYKIPSALQQLASQTGQSISSVSVDIVSYRDLCAALQGGVHTVLHLASMVDTSLKKNPRVWQVNVTGTQNVIHACISCSIPNLVYTSSEDVCLSDVAVTDGDESTPYPARLIHPYVATKMAAEKMVLAADGLDSLKTIALRPVHIYGPHDPHAIVHSLREFSSGRVPFCLGSGAAQFEVVYVDNVCHGHLLAARALADPQRSASVSGQAFFLTEGHRMNYFDWLRPYARAKGVKIPSWRLPDNLTLALAWGMEQVHAWLGLDVPFHRFHYYVIGRDFSFNSHKAQRLLGYSPLVDRETALQCTLEWLKGVDLKPAPVLGTRKTE